MLKRCKIFLIRPLRKSFSVRAEGSPSIARTNLRHAYQETFTPQVRDLWSLPSGRTGFVIFSMKGHACRQRLPCIQKVYWTNQRR